MFSLSDYRVGQIEETIASTVLRYASQLKVMNLIISSSYPGASAVLARAILDDMVDMAAGMFTAKRFFEELASSKAILALPVPKFSETAAEQGCAVCGQRFQEGDKVRMMPCSHSFHQSCIFKRLLGNRVCPCCRFTMPAADEQDDDMSKKRRRAG
ncbi:hypothetical protein SETIT_2G061300v2 [Setaria italica]|uniref:RING-type domain-containing protein n=2 Tax=Setaria italica TaxID=4555 RepID=A0A368PW06_SETIT|nr:hypothetical protein SETIT_2G061300v2 [Setaria italica]